MAGLLHWGSDMRAKSRYIITISIILIAAVSWELNTCEAQPSQLDPVEQHVLNILQKVEASAESAEELAPIYRAIRITHPGVLEHLSPIWVSLSDRTIPDSIIIRCGLEILAAAYRALVEQGVPISEIEILLTQLFDFLDEHYYTEEHFVINYTLLGDHAIADISTIEQFGQHLEDAYDYIINNLGYDASGLPARIEVDFSFQDVDQDGSTIFGQYNPFLDHIWINTLLETSYDQTMWFGVSAHELYHLVTERYASLVGASITSDIWFVESTAAWLEFVSYRNQFGASASGSDDCWDLFQKRVSRFLNAPYKSLLNDWEENPYRPGAFFYSITHSTEYSFLGAGNENINFPRVCWEEVDDNGWAFFKNALDDAFSRGSAVTSEFDKALPIIAGSWRFYQDMISNSAGVFSSVWRYSDYAPVGQTTIINSADEYSNPPRALWECVS